MWKPKKAHSLEQLKCVDIYIYIRVEEIVEIFLRELKSYHTLRFNYQVLQRNSVVTDHNRQLLVETFRSIAEILIWGDQNDSRVFE